MSGIFNYGKLMALSPTVYDTMTNSLNQEIDLVEHPTKGDEYFVIAVCHELEVAEATCFFETDDMIAEHGEYEPTFVDGRLHIGGSLEND